MRFEFREAMINGMIQPYVFDKKTEKYLNPFECVDLLNKLYKEKNEFQPIIFKTQEGNDIILYSKGEIND